MNFTSFDNYSAVISKTTLVIGEQTAFTKDIDFTPFICIVNIFIDGLLTPLISVSLICLNNFFLPF